VPHWAGCNAGWILEPGHNPQGSKGQSSTATIGLQFNKTRLARVAPALAGSVEPQQMLAPGNANNTIWFKVAFSSQPQLQVTYLTSYVLFGVAELAIFNSTNISTNSSALAVYTLDARIRAIYSIPRTTVLVQSSMPGKTRAEHVERLPSQIQQGEYVVAVRPLNGTNLQGQKFKLLGISSC